MKGKRVMAAFLIAGLLTGCTGREEQKEPQDNLVELTWYQVGNKQKDDALVLEEVNEYLAEKIGVKLNIKKVSWGDYNQKMQVVIATEEEWYLCFTSSWANDRRHFLRKQCFMN